MVDPATIEQMIYDHDGQLGQLHSPLLLSRASARRVMNMAK